MMKPSTIFTFLGGAALGALVAMLLAPESGRKTRKKIKRKLKKRGIDLSTDELSELINHFKHGRAKKTIGNIFD